MKLDFQANEIMILYVAFSQYEKQVWGSGLEVVTDDQVAIRSWFRSIAKKLEDGIERAKAGHDN